MSERTNYCISCFKTEENCKCKSKEYIILLDNNMVNIISILNKKGYTTKYCCESHPHEYIPNLYVMFWRDMSCVFKELPKLFCIDMDGRRLIKVCKTQKDKDIGLRDLSEWCVKLSKFSE